MHSAHAPPEHREPERPSWPAFTFMVAVQPDAAGSPLEELLRNPATRYAVVLDKGGLADNGCTRLWVPGGRVDAGEGAMAAGVRETAEEAGLVVTPLGITNVSRDGHGVLRTVYVGIITGRVELSTECASAGDAEAASLYAKEVVDFESCGAVLATAAQIAALADDDVRGYGLEHVLRLRAAACGGDAALAASLGGCARGSVLASYLREGRRDAPPPRMPFVDVAAAAAQGLDRVVQALCSGAFGPLTGTAAARAGHEASTAALNALRGVCDSVVHDSL
jgi:ADP-ribose pyrophosphatase YjhB (NUDIX family)